MREDRRHVGRPAVVGAAEGQADAPRTNVDWPEVRQLDTSVQPPRLWERIRDAVRRAWDALTEDELSSMRRP